MAHFFFLHCGREGERCIIHNRPYVGISSDLKEEPIQELSKWLRLSI